MNNQHQNQKKTVIGVLASHDDNGRNNALVDLFNRLRRRKPNILEKFSFVFTGGTFDRIILGTQSPKIKPVDNGTRKFLFNKCGVICLPPRLEGVTVLAYLIAQRKVSIIWPFLTPLTTHWLNPENIALLRLCDQWHAKKLMNKGSVEEWFEKEAQKDANRNLQTWPLNLVLRGSKANIPCDPIQEQAGNYQKIKSPEPVASPKSATGKSKKEPFENMTIALIAHDEMKNRMADFAIDYETELGQFAGILTTSTTGRLVREAAPTLEKKIYLYHSGPKGGDIEIATEILFGHCHVVVFFVDPLHPHPHIEDIRVVFGACIIQDEVRMLSNEMQAREWMDTVVKGC